MEVNLYQRFSVGDRRHNENSQAAGASLAWYGNTT